MNRNCASVGANAAWRLRRLLRSFTQSAVSATSDAGVSFSSAMIRRPSAPVDASNEDKRIVESCAKTRVARGGTAACGEARARTARGTKPSRTETDGREREGPPSSPASSSPSARSFSPPCALRRIARTIPSAKTTRRSKCGGTPASSSSPGSSARERPVNAAAALDDDGFFDDAPPSVRSSASSSSTPYLARLYREPAAGPASLRSVGSEPGAGSLIRYLRRRAERGAAARGRR